jgi:hypothetical protein
MGRACSMNVLKKKSYNKLNTTWKIVNTESGRTSKHDDTQHLIEKFNS